MPQRITSRRLAPHSTDHVLLTTFNWRCTWWGRPAAAADVITAGLGVIRRFGEFSGRIRAAGFEHFLEERPAPAATCPRAEAIGELRGTLRAFESQEVGDLALRDVKTKAEFVVGFHEGEVRGEGSGSGGEL